MCFKTNLAGFRLNRNGEPVLKFQIYCDGSYSTGAIFELKKKKKFINLSRRKMYPGYPLSLPCQTHLGFWFQKNSVDGDIHEGRIGLGSVGAEKTILQSDVSGHRTVVYRISRHLGHRLLSIGLTVVVRHALRVAYCF